MAKHAAVYASQNPKISSQKDIRSVVVNLFRPVFPAKELKLRIHEISIGRNWSTLRVELFQGSKLTASADVT